MRVPWLLKKQQVRTANLGFYGYNWQTEINLLAIALVIIIDALLYLCLRCSNLLLTQKETEIKALSRLLG